MKKLYTLILITTLVLCQGCASLKFWNHSETAKPKGPDEIEYSKLNWNHGGINGANAQLTTALICNANFGPNGLSYKWKENDLSVWGYARTQADARTCVFYLKDGKWYGGFFEWVSTSRTTRDWKNIKTKYKGWTWDEIPNGADGAMVILSRDGKKRTNVIKTKWNKK